MTTLSLSPLLRHSIGFDRFNDLFETAMRSDGNAAASYPPYNIVKRAEDDYTITMAVAGFSERDINITAQNDRLLVAGRIEDKTESDTAEYLYRGIATRAFERSFRLADHMQVKGAELKDGMLHIQLKREVPEEAKPRMIPINGAAALNSEANAKVN